ACFSRTPSQTPSSGHHQRQTGQQRAAQQAFIGEKRGSERSHGGAHSAAVRLMRPVAHFHPCSPKEFQRPKNSQRSAQRVERRLCTRDKAAATPNSIQARGPLSGCGATNEQPPFSDDRPNSGSLAEVTPPVATVGADPAPPVVVAGIPPADAGLPPAPPVAIPKLPPPLLSPPPMELPPVAAPPVSEPPVPPLPDVPPVPGSSGSFGV